MHLADQHTQGRFLNPLINRGLAAHALDVLAHGPAVLPRVSFQISHPFMLWQGPVTAASGFPPHRRSGAPGLTPACPRSAFGALQIPVDGRAPHVAGDGR